LLKSAWLPSPCYWWQNRKNCFADVDRNKMKLRTVLFVCLHLKNERYVDTNTTATQTEKVITLRKPKWAILRLA
jgi:hypothetical protein